VKELSKKASHESTLDYRRELEAIAKFSHERVGSINRHWRRILTCESVSRLFSPLVWLVREQQRHFHYNGVHAVG
jgi:hypothetical protein